jgi:aminoglycoside 3-N-acetyltransferase
MLKTLKDWVKAGLREIGSKRRAATLKAQERHIEKAEITADLTALGLVPGDTVMMHSSLKSLGYVEGGAMAVLEAVFAAISPGGTLVVPTYYLPGGTIHATCKMPDYIFDPRVHGSNLGKLPDTFLKFPGVQRSIHPTHSVSAVGPQAAYVVGDHHRAPSVFGTGSPWDRCVELNAKVLGLGITMGPVTFYHLLEDRMLEAFPLPVRMKETYRMPCLDWHGNRIEVPVTPLDPEFMPRRIDHPSRDDVRQFFWNDFRAAGIMTVGTVGGATTWYVPAQDFYQRLVALVAKGITIYAPLPEQ